MNRIHRPALAGLLLALLLTLPGAAWPQQQPQAPAPKVSLVPISAPKPEVPDSACQQRLSGWVEMEFAVLPDGRVAEVRVVKSQPAGAFDAAATTAVSGRLYSPQPAPVKMKERMLMTYADCRAEQLRPAEGAVASPVDCVILAAEARKAGERFDAAESGRAVLQGETPQAYSAPSSGCEIAGRKLKPGGKWTAHVEHNGYSLISGPKPNEDAGIWVPSRLLKDTDPVGGVASIPTPAVTAAVQVQVQVAPASSGERLAYAAGCISCHHRAPKDANKAPALSGVQAYSLPEFRKLLKSGVTRAGRNLATESTPMGIAALEQFAYLSDDEVTALFDFLRTGWTPERAAQEEARRR